jgi:hypothetical protein
MDTYQFLFCMSFYCRDDDWSDDESDADFDSMHKHKEYSHSEIIHQCNFDFRHLINAHLSSEMSLQYQADSNTHGIAPHCLNSNDINSDHGTEEAIKTFPTMLKLIGGTLVGGVKYSDLYIDSNEDKDTSFTNSYVTNNDKGHDKNIIQHIIPTLPQIAQKVAKLEKTQLDEKQYIAYEMIAYTFLLGLVNDGCNRTTKLGMLRAIQSLISMTTSYKFNRLVV